MVIRNTYITQWQCGVKEDRFMKSQINLRPTLLFFMYKAQVPKLQSQVT